MAPRGRRGGARHAQPAGAADPGGARRVRHHRRRRARLRGRRRARHPAARRSPAPVEVASGDRDLFQLVDDARAGAAALRRARAWPSWRTATTPRCAPATGCRPTGTPTSPPCAATPATGCPACRAWARRPPPGWSTATASLAGILAALDDPGSGFAPGLRAKLAAARDYLAVAPKVVRVALDVPLPALDTALPAAPADPDRLLELAERVEPGRLGPPPRRRPRRPRLTVGAVGGAITRSALASRPMRIGVWPHGSPSTSTRAGRSVSSQSSPTARNGSSPSVRRCPVAALRAVSRSSSRRVGAAHRVRDQQPVVGVRVRGDRPAGVEAAVGHVQLVGDELVLAPLGAHGGAQRAVPGQQRQRGDRVREPAGDPLQARRRLEHHVGGQADADVVGEPHVAGEPEVDVDHLAVASGPRPPRRGRAGCRPCGRSCWWCPAAAGRARCRGGRAAGRRC